MRLLFAEDERELSKAVKAILTANHYAVDCVYDGEEAYDYLSSQPYDGAILDIMMPKMDGLSVVRKIRSEGNRVPVLFLTARSGLDDRVEGLDSGADDYLAKPFAMKELLARIRAITRRTGDLRDPILTYGDLSLDPSTCILTCQGQSVPLSGKEFQLLELMMRHPNKVFSQDLLMDRVWGPDAEADISTVWACLSYLRKKLKTVGSTVKIRARRNIGYSLDRGEA